MIFWSNLTSCLNLILQEKIREWILNANSEKVIKKVIDS